MSWTLPWSGPPRPPLTPAVGNLYSAVFLSAGGRLLSLLLLLIPFFFFFLESACLLLLAQHMHEQEFVVQKEKNSLLLNWPIWRWGANAQSLAMACRSQHSGLGGGSHAGSWLVVSGEVRVIHHLFRPWGRFWGLVLGSLFSLMGK